MNYTSMKTVARVTITRLLLVSFGAVCMYLAFTYNMNHADVTEFYSTWFVKIPALLLGLGMITLGLTPKAKTMNYFLGLNQRKEARKHERSI